MNESFSLDSVRAQGKCPKCNHEINIELDAKETNGLVSFSTEITCPKCGFTFVPEECSITNLFV